MNDQLSAEEKEKALLEFEQKQVRMYNKGKTIVISIAVINILSVIVSQFIRFNFFSLIAQIILSVMLIAGVSWVRYLFAAGAFLNVFLLMYIILNLAGFGFSGRGIVLIIILLQIAFSALSAVLLFASKSVSEFLYAQKNG